MIKQCISINFEVKTFSYTFIFIYIQNPQKINKKKYYKNAIECNRGVKKLRLEKGEFILKIPLLTTSLSASCLF